MKKILLFFLIVFGISSLVAQTTSNTMLVRSTTSNVGSSEKVTVNNKTYRIQQSVGQGSIIGLASNGKYTLRQGFIQPNVLSKITDKNIPITLQINTYPNPFTEGITVSFTDNVTTDINIVLYDVLGRLLYSKKHSPKQSVHINLEHLAIGNYLLKVQTNQQQIIKNILKK
ncbi:MAG: T9SS type A sorting domain-containing protein [Polaribacter sp.]|nr:T9SS type A sorting domain-containing protein [Polaribacter sp.]